MKQTNKKGFTLIELLVVIAIIGLLSTLAVVALNNARQKSRDAKRVADVKQIQTALELSFNDQGKYPTAALGVVLGTGNYQCLGSDVTGGQDGFDAAGACAGTVYMAQVPSNPTPTDDGGCAVNAYTYDSLNGSTYRLTYCVGEKTGGIAAGENIACEGGVSGCSAP
jgi:prepilin-type N-terminal cleavage/methylation domain-containing protein